MYFIQTFASTGHIALLAMWIQNGSYPPAKFDVNWYSIFIFYIFYCIRIGNEFLNLQRKGSWNSNSTLSSVSLWWHPEVVSICTVKTVSRKKHSQSTSASLPHLYFIRLRLLASHLIAFNHDQQVNILLILQYLVW